MAYFVPIAKPPLSKDNGQLASVHMASNHHTSLSWKKLFSSNLCPLVPTNLGSILLHLSSMACVILDPAVMRQQQYFEQAAEKPTYPTVDTSLPSPLEGDNPMGEVSENEGLHNQDFLFPGLISCDQPCLFLTSHMKVKILCFLEIMFFGIAKSNRSLIFL